MARLLLVGLFVVISGAGRAEADPLVRFGMTFGVDRNIPEAHEFGPMLAVGANAGRFTGELNYSYLSMFDDVSKVHRAGVSLRMDLWRAYRFSVRRASTSSRAVYAELGAARRAGQWTVNELEPVSDKRQSELQVGVGYQLSGNGGAWQAALRFGFARRDPMLEVACRGVTCPVSMPASTGIAESVMLEWTWILGGGH